MSCIARRPRRVRGWTAALLTAAIALSGCAAGQISQTADQVSGVDGASGDAGYIGVRNVLLATPEKSNYPKGSDAQLLLWISNDGNADDTLKSVSSPDAASVEITGDAKIPAAALVQVAPEKKIAMTVKGLTKDVDYGFSIPVTFSFAAAGEITINVPVEIPDGRAVSDRPTVNIQPGEPPDLWEPAEPGSSGSASTAPAPSLAASTAPAPSSAAGSSAPSASSGASSETPPPSG